MPLPKQVESDNKEKRKKTHPSFSELLQGVDY
jgi:hypothetical protein